MNENNVNFIFPTNEELEEQEVTVTTASTETETETSTMKMMLPKNTNEPLKTFVIEKEDKWVEIEERIKNEEDPLKQLAMIEQETKKALKETADQYNDVIKDWTLKKVTQDVKDEYERTKAPHYKNMAEELISSRTLKILFDNDKKSATGYGDNSNFKKEQIKFYKKLKNMKKYKYRDPSPLLEILTKELKSEESAKIFLYSFYKFINPKGNKKFRKYSVFVGEVINNILACDEKYSQFIISDADRGYRRQIITYIKKYIKCLKGV